MPPAKSPGRKKKGPSTDMAKAIVVLRDKLIEEGKDAETVGLACKGMYKCDKTINKACLEGIMKKLEVIKKGGGPRRSKSRSHSRSRSRSAKRK